MDTEIKLTPVKINATIKAESIKAAKFIHIGTKKIPIENIRLDKVAKAYFTMMRKEITQEKVNEFIKNF